MRRAAFAVLVCAACTRAPPEGGPLTVGFSALRISLPLAVADERGMFARRGLDVELRRYETAQPLVEELLDGRVLAGGYAALPIVFTAAARSGAELRVASAMVEDQAHPVTRLLKRRGDTTLGSIGDLRGRRVGILPTVAYRRWLELLARGAGLDPAALEVVPIAPAQQAAALAEGGVDALLTNDPMASAAVHSGKAELLVAGSPVAAASGGALLFGGFLVHPRLLAERPRDAELLLEAIDEAIAFIEAHQDEARRALLPHVREAERAFVPAYPPARYLPSAEVSARVLGEEVSAERRLGILDAPVDAARWVLAP